MKIVMALCAAVVAAVLIGCGGSDEEAPTKKEYAAEANAICKRGFDSAFEALGKATEKKEKETGEFLLGKESAELAGATVPALEQMVEELEDLTPPEAEAEQVETMVENFDRGVQEIKEDPLITVEENPTFPAMQEANELELKVCGRAAA